MAHSRYVPKRSLCLNITYNYWRIHNTYKIFEIRPFFVFFFSKYFRQDWSFCRIFYFREKICNRYHRITSRCGGYVKLVVTIKPRLFPHSALDWAMATNSVTIHGSVCDCTPVRTLPCGELTILPQLNSVLVDEKSPRFRNPEFTDNAAVAGLSFRRLFPR